MPRGRALPGLASYGSTRIPDENHGAEGAIFVGPGPVAQRIERRTSNPRAEVRLLPGPLPKTAGKKAKSGCLGRAILLERRPRRRWCVLLARRVSDSLAIYGIVL